ncbi:transcriptional repressor LexA [bacterium]|nr:transcriptional repressor LexA [bacterium]
MTKRHDLTPMQERMLDYIAETIQDCDRSPTMREIGEAMGISSTNGVRYHLSALEERGYIRRRRGISRGIEWLEHHLASGERRGGAEIPLVGSVSAGRPILAVENIEAVIAVDEMFARREGCFALRVLGDSMRDAGIHNGDVVIVNPEPDARNGDVIVAMIDDEATVKEYQRRGEHICLKAHNPAYDDIELTGAEGEVRVLGKVVGLMRKF